MRQVSYGLLHALKNKYIHILLIKKNRSLDIIASLSVNYFIFNISRTK